MTPHAFPAFAVPSRALTRLDVTYSLALAVGSQTDNVNRVSVGSLLVDLRYGTSTRATQVPVGLPVIRMSNINDGALDLRELKYATLTEREKQRFLLREGDVLVNRTNTKELVGKAAQFEEEGEWLFASYLLRLRVDVSRVLPGFLVSWLNSPDARAQIDKVSRQAAGMTNINSNDVRALQMPLPSLAAQERLVSGLMQARKDTNRTQSEALAVIQKATDDVERRAGIGPYEREGALVYAVPPTAIAASNNRLDVLAYHPARVAARAQVASRANAPLGDLVRNIVERAGGADSDCLSLADVETASGLLSRGDRGSKSQEIGGALRYSSGDILYGRLRPALNKVWLAEDSGCCSPEFRVLRAAPTTIDPAYLAAVMRSSIFLDQAQYVATGNTHPRITDSDLMALLIPLVDLALQRSIAENVLEAQQTFGELQSSSVNTWRSAKEEFAQRALQEAL